MYRKIQRVLHMLIKQFLIASSIAISCSTTIASEVEDISNYEFNQQLLNATVWVEVSSEYKALSHQAFNVARYNLKEFVKSSDGKPFAVVVDIDETVLSNARYEAWLINQGVYHSGKRQKLWADAAIAPALPGAVDFLNEVKEIGGEVFYITNRKDDTREGTLKNLKIQGFPFADEQHLLTKSDSSDKSLRRAKVAEQFQIALLIGDNLNDFHEVFDTDNFEDTNRAVEDRKALFGTKYIVLPNPMYGEWEKKIYNGNWRLPNIEKTNLKNKALDPWLPTE